VSGPRIVVFGCAGTEKTRFARLLSQMLGCAHLCLDEMWRAEPEHEVFRARVKETHACAAWVSDGNFAAAVTFDLRLPQATLIIWLEAARWLCRWRVASRVRARGEHHQRRDVGDVWRFIAGFDRVNAPRIEAGIAAHGAQVPRLQLQGRAIADFLGS